MSPWKCPLEEKRQYAQLNMKQSYVFGEMVIKGMLGSILQNWRLILSSEVPLVRV